MPLLMYPALLLAITSSSASAEDLPVSGAYRNVITNAVRFLELDGDTIHWRNEWDSDPSLSYHLVAECARFWGEDNCYQDDSYYKREIHFGSRTSFSYKNTSGVESNFVLVSPAHLPLSGEYRNVDTNSVWLLDFEDGAIHWKADPDADPVLSFEVVEDCARFSGKKFCYQDGSYYQREMLFRNPTSFSYQNSSGVESQFVLEKREGAVRNLSVSTAPARYVDADYDELYWRANSADEAAALTFTYDEGECLRFEGRSGCYRDPAPHYREIFYYDATSFSYMNNSGTQTDFISLADDSLTAVLGPAVVAPEGWKCTTPQCEYLEELVCGVNDDDAPADQTCTEPSALEEDGESRSPHVVPRFGELPCAYDRIHALPGEFGDVSPEYSCTYDCDDYAYDQCVEIGWDVCRVLVFSNGTEAHAINVITREHEGEDYYCLWEPNPEARKDLPEGFPNIEEDCWPVDEETIYDFNPPDDAFCGSALGGACNDDGWLPYKDVALPGHNPDDAWWEDPYGNPTAVFENCVLWNEKYDGALKMHEDVPTCDELDDLVEEEQYCDMQDTQVCKEVHPENGGDVCRLKICDYSCPGYAWVDYDIEDVPDCDPTYGEWHDDIFLGSECPPRYTHPNPMIAETCPTLKYLREHDESICKRWTGEPDREWEVFPVRCMDKRLDPHAGFQAGAEVKKDYHWLLDADKGQPVEHWVFSDPYCESDTGGDTGL